MRFRKWAASKVEGAKHMNVGSGDQIRQLLFAGTLNAKQPAKEKGKAKPPDNRLDCSRTFKVLHLLVPSLCNATTFNVVIRLASTVMRSQCFGQERRFSCSYSGTSPPSRRPRQRKHNTVQLHLPPVSSTPHHASSLESARTLLIELRYLYGPRFCNATQLVRVVW